MPSLLRPHEPSDSAIFPGRDAQKFYDFGAPDDQEWLVDEIVGHRWKGRNIEFLVHWSLGDHTWEPLAHCDELQALDEYLSLMGATDWKELPRKTSTTGRRRADREVAGGAALQSRSER